MSAECRGAWGRTGTLGFVQTSKKATLATHAIGHEIGAAREQFFRACLECELFPPAQAEGPELPRRPLADEQDNVPVDVSVHATFESDLRKQHVGEWEHRRPQGASGLGEGALVRLWRAGAGPALGLSFRRR